MSYSALLVEESEEICTITLNRPERRNALTPALRQELIEALKTARERAQVVILTGAGAAFCAGLDLEALAALAEFDEKEQTRDAELIAELFRTLYTLQIPTIAAVNGAAIAGGTGLATLCDFTLAVPEAKFGYTEVRIGFVPALVSAYLGMQIGSKRAKGLLLSGRLFDAREAAGLGLVDELVEATDLLARARALAIDLLKNSPAAMRQTKQLILDESLEELDRRIALALKANVEARKHPDFKEGVRAFLGKRKPEWKR